MTRQELTKLNDWDLFILCINKDLGTAKQLIHLNYEKLINLYLNNVK